MPRRTWTDEQRTHALNLYIDHGPAEAGRQTGIPKGTIARWAHETGTGTVRTENTRAATEAAMATLAQRKAQLADGLLADAQRLRTQMFARCTVFSFGGKDNDFASAEVDEPSFADKRQIMTSIAIAVDKIQLLTGEATSRTEHTGDVESLRARAAELDELAQRRAERGAA